MASPRTPKRRKDANVRPGTPQRGSQDSQLLKVLSHVLRPQRDFSRCSGLQLHLYLAQNHFHFRGSLHLDRPALGKHSACELVANELLCVLCAAILAKTQELAGDVQ